MLVEAVVGEPKKAGEKQITTERVGCVAAARSAEVVAEVAAVAVARNMFWQLVPKAEA